MASPTFAIEAEGIRVELDLAVGHIARLAVTRDGRTVAPLHRAPWADDPQPPAGTDEAPHLARISGDFLCAPFAAADVEPAPAHGWTANAPWIPLGARAIPDGITASFALDRPVMGARVVKEFTVRNGHPFLYQRHLFEGGAGALPVAHHAMVHLPSGGTLAVSPKRFAETPPAALETDPARGRSALAYPARSADPARFPKADGTEADLTRYPIDSGHEDFVMLVEAEGAALGWSAVTRTGEDDLALFLKNPTQLPVTMLWFSNGGRHYAPWSDRHTGVLGVEDGRSFSLHGHAASAAENDLTRIGVPTAFPLDPRGSVEVRHVIGAMPLPSGFGAAARLSPAPGALQVESGSGARLTLPYDDAFLARTG